MKIEIRAPSHRAIIEALEEKINSFSKSNKDYNESRKYRLALKELKRSINNKNK